MVLISFNEPLECEWNNGTRRDIVYCSGNIFILIGSAVNSLLLVAILHQHFKSKAEVPCSKHFRTKPLILYLMIIYEIMVFVRYLFNFNGK